MQRSRREVLASAAATGLHGGTDHGSALVDLYDDGTVACRYIP
jgi:nitrous oxide reductase